MDDPEIRGLQTVAQREELLLAPYAMHSRDSAGRRYPEDVQAYRGPFQRDRDRILHCSAFRRLSGKMQVFTGDMGDYHRTRLTHTHEVASIARTIARGLRLNEDLVEALALFHDIGHAPFGHAGEDALNECLADVGGFSHNQHALTVVEEIEERYPGFPGLNLSFEVLEGQAVRVQKASSACTPLLEVQVVDAADSITYDAHDTDDAMKLGMVSLDELSSIPLVGRMLQRVRQRHANLHGGLLRKALVHELIDCQVTDVLMIAGAFLSRGDLRSADDVRRSEFKLGPSAELAEQKRELEAFLYRHVYRHPKLLAVRVAAQQRLRAMFAELVRRPDLLPSRFRGRPAKVGLQRSAGEYLASMTERFCDEQFDRYFHGSLG